MRTPLPRPSAAATAPRRAHIAACVFGLLTLWAAWDSGVVLAANPAAALPPIPLPAPQDDDDDMMRPEAAAAAVAPRGAAEDRPAAAALRPTFDRPPAARAAAFLSLTLPSFDRRNGIGAPLRC